MTDFEITGNITPEEYMELRKLVGWGLFPLEQAKEGIKNTYILICLRKDGKPIALGRAVSDRGYVVYIADVMVSLLASKGKESFYNTFGFVDRPNESFGCGMHQWLEG